ncbi:MAG: cob(I)yrinic acid a,c-diamide adenosyltransferase [Zavarzinella sp.]
MQAGRTAIVTLSRIYTKTGDSGETSMGNGERLAKNHIRIHAMGDVDELNSALGLILLQSEIPMREQMTVIQNELFDLGADLCMPFDPHTSGSELRIIPEQVVALEQQIDFWNENLPTLQSFVLPGGNAAGAQMHLARAICRRAERSVVALEQTEPINPHSLIYLNRLSDLLFVWARVVNVVNQAEVLWIPGKSRSN